MEKMQQLKGSDCKSFKLKHCFYRGGITEAQKWRDGSIWPLVSKGKKNQFITNM